MIVLNCDQNSTLMLENKKKIIENFYKEDECSIENNLKKLEDLNFQLKIINEEKENKIEVLKTCISEFDYKNQNLIFSTFKMQNKLDDHIMKENELQSQLKELENILDFQNTQKNLLENKVALYKPLLFNHLLS